MPKEIEEPYVGPNPEIKTFKKVHGALVIERTHAKPIVHKKSHSIDQARAQIAKINSVVALWESKKAPFQAIIDKYNSIA